MKISGNLSNILELHKIILKNQRAKEETQKGARKYFKLNKNKTYHVKIWGMQPKASNDTKNGGEESMKAKFIL